MAPFKHAKNRILLIKNWISVCVCVCYDVGKNHLLFLSIPHLLCGKKIGERQKQQNQHMKESNDKERLERKVSHSTQSLYGTVRAGNVYVEQMCQPQVPVPLQVPLSSQPSQAPSPLLFSEGLFFPQWAIDFSCFPRVSGQMSCCGRQESRNPSEHILRCMPLVFCINMLTYTYTHTYK